MKTIVLIVLAVLVVHAAHAQDHAAKEALRPVGLLKSLHQKYAPDTRTAIFTVAARMAGDTCVLNGEVASEEVRKDVLAAFSARAIPVVDSITVLPSKAMGPATWGIITVSVANMRTDPREAAELGSQTLMGSVVRVFKKKYSWYYLQSPDRYLGWVDGEQFYHCTKAEADAWVKAEKVFVTVPYDFVKEERSQHASSVCDVVGGAVLKKLGEEKEWTHVALADGRTGYIARSSVVDAKTWGTEIVPRADRLETTAKQFLGIPYLWGGTSVKGMDCSGFTKTVYLLNGMLLKRDANQQAEDGIEVVPGKNWENLRKGDLLFFGHKGDTDHQQKISHVGMYLEDRMFIQSAGMIKMSSLDPASPLYDEYHVKTFVKARRMIP